MGGFRRIYPHKTGEYYSAFTAHVASKMPYGTVTSTSRIHKLVTALEKRALTLHDNGIEDKSYKHGEKNDESEES